MLTTLDMERKLSIVLSADTTYLELLRSVPLSEGTLLPVDGVKGLQKAKTCHQPQNMLGRNNGEEMDG